MIRALDNLGSHYMSIDEAQAYDQRPFRSMLLRGWCAYRPKHGFHITRAGKAALHEFLSTDIARKDATLPLTAYFDPTAYGLHPTRVHVMPKRKVA